MLLISIAKFIENAAEIGILCTNLIIMQCAVQNSKVYRITGTLKHLSIQLLFRHILWIEREMRYFNIG